MPGRKSADATAVARSTENGDETAPAKAAKNASDVGVEDLNLPRSIVSRLSKGKLPANTQIQKDALLAISKSATVFVSYLANCANDRAVLAGKKTIQPKDVLDALVELEFDGFAARCEAELTQYNKIQCDKRNDYRRRVREDKAVPGTDNSEVAQEDGEVSMTNGQSYVRSSLQNGNAMRESPPATKKIRTSGGGAADGYDSTLNDDADGDTVDENDVDEDDQSENEDDQDDEEDLDETGQEPEADVEDPIDVDDSRHQLDDDDDDDDDEDGSESD